MTEWWHLLHPHQQVFYGIAIVATCALLLQLILGLVGIDHGVDDVDMGTTDHGGGVGVFSIQAISTFFVGLSHSSMCKESS